jgi:hypothetical protein
MNKIIILLLACTDCPIEKLVFDYNPKQYKYCSDKAYEIYEEIADFYWSEKGVRNHSAYYTKDNKLIVGHIC